MATALVRVCTALALFFGLSGSGSASPMDYRLGPQDKLQIDVYDVRTGTGEAHEWTAFNGEFQIGASGRVALPIIGEVDANGATPGALADVIAAKLQAKVGLSARPDASVEVIKYRPFYILGLVDKPGEYDYRPDLTVLQGVSTAGGLSRLSGMSLAAFEHDAIANRGDLRALTAERDALVIQQARLDAEVNGADKVTWPAIAAKRATDPDIVRSLREEQLIFDAHRDSLTSQTAALVETRTLLKSEISSLAAKDESLAHQLDITSKELQQISALVAKGLTVLPRQLEAEQSTATYQSSRLDVQVATLRAQQDISRTERDELELKNTRRAEALKETSEVHARLVLLDQKIATAQRLIDQTAAQAPELLDPDLGRQSALYTITRKKDDGSVTTIPAVDTDPVQPGDVVHVEIPRNAGLSTSALAQERQSSTN